MKFDQNNSLRRWSTFFALLQSSVGQSLTQDKSVQEWNWLRHRDSNIDYFFDRIHHLIYATGYTGKMVREKIKEGLTDEMRRSWAMVQGKPEKIYPYMDALREVAHEIERTAEAPCPLQPQWKKKPHQIFRQAFFSLAENPLLRLHPLF